MKAADWIQAISAIVITIATVVGAATVYYARLTKRLLEVQTDQAVSLDIEAPFVASPDEPLNFVVLNNFGPSSVIEVPVLAEPHGSVPFPVRYGC